MQNCCVQDLQDPSLEGHKSDTELIDLDPLAPLDHLNSVIEKLEARESAAELELARHRGYEAVPKLGHAMEGSIFGEPSRHIAADQYTMTKPDFDPACASQGPMKLMAPGYGHAWSLSPELTSSRGGLSHLGC